MWTMKMHSYKAHVVSEMKTQQTLICKTVPTKEMISGLGASLKKIDENIAQEDKEIYKTGGVPWPGLWRSG